MQMPQITMHSTMARIGMQSENAHLDIKQPQVELSIQTSPPDVEIHSQPATVQIDETQAWNNLNLKSAFVRVKEAAENGHQDAMEGIARRSEEADQLMHIEQKGNAFAAIARNNAFQQHPYDTGDVPPFQAVTFQVTPGSIDIQVNTYQPVIQVQNTPPEMNYTPANLSIYMVQYPEVMIEPPGSMIDEKG